MPFMAPRDKTVLIIHETRKLVDFLAFAMQISRTRLEPVEALAVEAASYLIKGLAPEVASENEIRFPINF